MKPTRKNSLSPLNNLAERRLGWLPFTRILWAMLGVFEAFLALRFGLKLMGADLSGSLAIFVYGLTGLFTAPFIGLVTTQIYGNAVVEVTTLIAMAVYAQLFLGIVTLLLIFMDQSRARLHTHHARADTGTTQEKTT